MDDLWKGLHHDPEPAPRVIENWDPEPWIPLRESRRLDRFTQFALVAAHEAINQARFEAPDPTRVAVAVATGIGGLESLENLIHGSEADQPRVSPFSIPMMMANAAAAAISIKYGFSGQASTPVVACAAGAQSVLDGLRQIEWGYADAVIAGGAEAAARIPAREGFKSARALSPSGFARPFDVDRDGFVMGEGAAMLVLEEEEAAKARGVTPLGRVLGGASTADAHHVTAPHPKGEGAERAVRLALEDSSLEPAEVGYINAHGTGTDLNDRTEGGVVRRIFGDSQPPISSIKGTTGHCLGASGSIEAAVSVDAIRRGFLPPNTGMITADPDIPLSDIVTESRAWEPAAVISNSFGFGGHNTVLVFGPA
jgi:3-oxoacyl-[acyl-carrier-protein] synthase II